ncbi:MAG: organomercurial lyase [Anaerolineae bacterium]|nr:organomercurial lyase [Anaerolineae bacterium]
MRQLDTLFLAAYIGKTATVTSICPQAEATISLTITPDGIETFTPAETVLSLVTATGCTAGAEGSFCGQIHFFASHDAAQTWIAERPDFAILTLAEAYQLAKQVYIEPVMKHIK